LRERRDRDGGRCCEQPRPMQQRRVRNCEGVED
jgi:hypothetical protein